MFKLTVSDTIRKKRSSRIRKDREYRAEMYQTEAENVSWKDVDAVPIPIRNCTASVEIKILSELKGICSEIKRNFYERLHINPALEAGVDAFHSDYSWFKKDGNGNGRVTNDLNQAGDSSNSTQDSEVIDDDGLIDDHNVENYQKAGLIIEKLIESLPEPLTINIDKPKATSGYLKFVELCVELSLINPQVTLENCYKKFYERYKLDEETLDFQILFEKIEIKTFSECYCETVGSVMKNAMGKGRNTHPVNFSKEIFFSVNSPPLHILSKNFIPSIVDQLLSNRSFIRSGDNRSNGIRSRLVGGLECISSSIFNFRKEEEMKSKLPLELFDV